MSETQKTENIVRLNDVRLSFPHLAEPQRDKEGKNPKYGALFLMPEDHPSVAQLKKMIVKAAKEKWPGGKHEAILKGLKLNNKLCLKPAELKADYEGFEEGFVFVSANNKAKPRVFNRDAEAITHEDEGYPYAGCYVNATVDVWAQDSADYGKRINATLRGVQFVRDGDAFGGGRVAEDGEFSALASGADDDTDFGADSDDDLV